MSVVENKSLNANKIITLTNALGKEITKLYIFNDIGLSSIDITKF